MVQEPHGLTELNQLSDFSNDNGKSCPRTLKMIGSEEFTIREAVKRTVWARNTQLTVRSYSPLEIATGRRPPDLLDIETSDPAQLSVDPLPEDKAQLELQRLALRAHQEARQAADLRHDMAKRTMPSDGPYKPGDKVFVWSSPVNANAIASKAWKKERWIRGTVISQEGAMVNVHVDNAVMRVNQSKVRCDHDEWHDVAVPGLDTSEPVPLAVEDEDDYEPDVAEDAEAYLGEQAHWFCQTGKCDVVELFSSNTGLSWHMARLNMKLVNLLTTSMVGVSTVRRNKTKFGNNLRSLILNMC